MKSKTQREIDIIYLKATIFCIIIVPIIWFVCLYFASYGVNTYPVGSRWVWDKYPNDTIIILKNNEDSICFKREDYPHCYERNEFRFIYKRFNKVN